MPDFQFNVKVEHPSDEAVVQAFQDLLGSTQNNLMRISSAHCKLQAKCDELSKENQTLRTENQHLRTEVSQLSALLAASRAGSGPGQRRMEEDEENGNFVLERTIDIHAGPVHSVAMGTDMDIVATASWDSTAKLYNLRTDEVVRTFSESQDGDEKMAGLYAIAFAKTMPEVLGCTSCDKSVYLWNHHTGKLLSKLTGHTNEVNDIDFHSLQQVMCTASDDCKVIIWDFQEGLTLRTLDKHTKAVYGATFLGPENQYFVATCCFDQKARVFDMRDKQVVTLLQQHTDDIIGIDYSCKQLLATGSDDGLICLWDTRTWKMLQKINTKREGPGRQLENEVKRVAFSPCGNSLAAACSSGRVLVYDITTYPAKQLASLGGHTDCVFDITWGKCENSNAKKLISASHDKTVRYWKEGAGAD